MREILWKSFPWLLLGCLCSCLLWPVVVGGNTSQTTSDMMSKPTSRDSTAKITGSTAVSSTAGPRQSTVPTPRTSAQDTSALSQNPQTQSMETTQESPSRSFTEVDTSTLSNSLSGNTVTVTMSADTSSPVEKATSFPSSVSNTTPGTAQMLTTPTTDSTAENTGDTSIPVTRSLTTVASGLLSTDSPGSSTVPTARTSTQDTSAFSQKPQTQSMETTWESTNSPLTEVNTSTTSTSLSVNTVTVTISAERAPPAEATTFSPSTVSNTPQTTEMLTTTDSTAENTGDTSVSVPASLTKITTGHSSTAGPRPSTVPTARTSTQDTSALSQNPQSQSMETIWESPSSSFTEGTTSTLSTPLSGNTVTMTISTDTSSPVEKATSSPSSVSNTPPGTAQMLTTPTTYSTAENTGDTSIPVTGSLTTVASGLSSTPTPGPSTVPTPKTSTQDTSALSQKPQTQNMETTREYPSSSFTEVNTSTKSTSLSRNTVTVTMSADTSSPVEKTTSSSSNVSNTLPGTAQMLTTPTTDSTAENTGDTSIPVSGSLATVTSGLSSTPTPGPSTVPTPRISTQDTSAFPQNPQSMEMTQGLPSKSFTEMSTSTLSTSLSGSTVAATISTDTSTPAEITTFSPSTVSNTLPVTVQMLITASTNSSVENTENISVPATGSLAIVTSGLLITAGQGPSTVPTARTSTQDTSALSQNPQTQSMETTRESPSRSFTEVDTSTLSTSLSGNTVTVTISADTFSSIEKATSFPSSVSNTTPGTAQMLTTPTTDSTAENMGDTSVYVPGSLTTVTSGLSGTPAPGPSTVPTPRLSTQDTSAFAQNPQTQSMETTQESQSSSFTEVEISTLSNSLSENTVAATISADTSSPVGKTTSSPSSVSNTLPGTAQMLTTPTTDSTAENTGDTSIPVTRSLTTVASGLLTTAGLGSSTVPTARTSTQDTSAFVQNSQTQIMETTRESPSSSFTEVTTSTLSNSLSGNTVKVTISAETFHPADTTHSFPFSVSNTPPVTAQMLTTSTTDSTAESMGDTSASAPASLTAVTSGLLSTTGPGPSTVPTPRISTQDTSAFSQNPQTQSMETTQGLPSKSFTEMSTSTLSTSLSGSTVAATISTDTSTPAEITTFSPSTVSNTLPVTVQMLITASTNSSVENTENISVPATGSLAIVTSGLLITAGQGPSTVPTARTSTQDTSALSQNPQTQSMETTRESPSRSFTEVDTSTLSTSLSGNTVTVTISADTFSPAAITTFSPSTVSNTAPVTTQMLITASTNHPVENTGDTSVPVTKSLATVTSGLSSPAGPGPSTVPTTSLSIRDTSTFALYPQNQSMETTRESPSRSFTEVNTSTLSTSLSGNTVTTTISAGTSLPAKTTTSSIYSVRNTPQTTIKMSITKASTDSTAKNMGDTSVPITRSIGTVMSGLSSTPGPGPSTVPTPKTSTQDTSAFSENPQTQSMETTWEYPSSSFTEVDTSTLSTSLSGNTVTVTMSADISSPVEKTTSSPSNVSNTLPGTAQKLTTPTTDSTAENMGDTSIPVTGSLATVTSGLPSTPTPGPSTVPTPKTSTQDASAFPQNPQTQSMETTQESPSRSFTEMDTSTLSTSLSGNTVTVTMSADISSPVEKTTSSPSNVSNTLPVTAQKLTTPTTDSTAENTGDTSIPVTRSLTTVASGLLSTAGPGSSTVPTARASTQDTFAFSQKPQTQNMETTRESPSRSFTEVDTSTLSTSLSGNTVTVTMSADISSPVEKTTSSPSNVSNTLPGTAQMLTTPTTDSTAENTGDTSIPVTGSLATVTSGLPSTPTPGPSTVPTPKTSTQDTSAFPQNPQTQSMETTQESPSRSFTEMDTSTLSTYSGNTVAVTISSETSSLVEKTTSSSSNVSNTLPGTAQMLTTPTTDSTAENTGDTSIPVTRSLTTVASGLLSTAGPGSSTVPTARTSTQDTSAFSQKPQTQNMETTRESPSRSFTEVDTSTLSTSLSGNTVTVTMSADISSPVEKTTSSSSNVSNTLPGTAQMLTTPTTDSTAENTGDTSIPVTGSLATVTSGLPSIPTPGPSTVPTPKTSTQDTSAFPQNPQTQSMETTQESPSRSFTEMDTSTLSTYSGNTVAVTISSETSSLVEKTTSSSSNVSNTLPGTAQMLTTPTTDSTAENTGDTSIPVTRSLTTVASGLLSTAGPGSSTVPTARASTQDTSAFSQKPQTQNMETTRESPSRSFTEVDTSTLSTSLSGNTVTVTMSADISSPVEKTTSSSSNVSNTLPGTAQMLTTPTTDSTAENTGDTSIPVTGSLATVTSGLPSIPTPGPSTVPTPKTSTQDTSAFPQNPQTQSMETTQESPSRSFTEMDTSTLSTSYSGNTVAVTISSETSSLVEKTTSSPSSASNTTPVTAQKLTTPTTDSTAENTGDTSIPVTRSLTTVASGLLSTAGPGSSTVPTARASTQDTSAFSQKPQTQNMETTRESPSRSFTEVDTSTLSTSLSGNTVTVTMSADISSPVEKTTSSSSNVSNTLPGTAQMLTTPTTDSTAENTGDTSIPVTGSLATVTSGLPSAPTPGPSTVPTPKTSTQDTSAFPQNPQTQSMETTQESPSRSFTEMDTSTLSTSYSGNTVAVTISSEISSLVEKITSSPSSASNTTPVTAQKLTTPTTDSTAENTGDTSIPVTRSLTTVASGLLSTAGPGSSTVPTARTSTQDTSTFSQKPQTQSMETTWESPSSPFTEVNTSTTSTSLSGNTVRVTISAETAPPAETTTSSRFSVSNTPQTTTDMLTTTPSTKYLGQNTGDTSLSVFGSLTTVASGLSSTAGPGPSTVPTTRTPTQDTSAFVQNSQTQIMETTRESPSSSFTEVTTSTLSNSLSGNTVKVTISAETFHPADTTHSFPFSVSNTPPVTAQMLTTSTTDSTAESMGDTSASAPASLTAVTSGLLSTTGPGPSTVPTLRTSTQDTSAFSQNPQTQSMEMTQGLPSKSFTEMSTSTLSTSLSGSTVAATTSTDTSTPAEITTFSPSTVSNMPQTTEMVTTTDSAAENTGDTSLSVPASLTTVISGLSSTPTPGPSTVPTSSLFTQDTSALPQNSQTQSIETPWESPSSTFTDVDTSTLSNSLSGNTVTATISAETSSLAETTTSPANIVSSTPQTTTKMLTTTASTDSSEENTEDILVPVTKSLAAVTSSPSETTTSPANIVSHTPQTTTKILTTTASTDSSEKNTEDILVPVTKSLAAVTSSPSETTTSPANIVSHTPQTTTKILTTTASTDSSEENTEDILVPVTKSLAAVTSPPAETTTSPANIVSSTPQTTTKMLTTTASTDSSEENTEDILVPVTKSLARVTSGFSSTAGPGPSTLPTPRTSGQDTSAFSQNPQTQSMVTTQESPPSPFTEVTTSTVSTSLTGNIVTVTISAETSSPVEPSTTALTLTTSTSGISMHSHSTASLHPFQREEGVPLLPYGQSAGDSQLSISTVDFTSKLFKPQMGFPLGSSLRESLYFTDNGQIIFPESDYQKFSYPNPPPGGFTGMDPVAIVAPFWDDADFSSDRGSIFYQEYETLYDEDNTLVRQVEIWIEKFTNTWSYKAKWTLKVTWVNAPAYPAKWTSGTNTYQAILSTDGSRSYALFLYQSGGMQWDTAQRWGNPVLMGFSSGDGHFENSPLMSRPLWEKYRPDRFLNSKLGLQGIQIYRIHGEERPNYRLKCLWWLKSQPQWSSWDWNQISCPCSWQQGRWDLRFQRVNIGWWDFHHRWLCSFSSWRGGVCCSYGSRGEFLEGWRMQSPWQLDQELEPQNWCCRWNDKPFFCTLYQQRRPRVSCAGYVPPRPAWMFGDPHITTLDGASYTFNGLGDFLLVRASDGNSSFLLQGRTAQSGSANATNFIAFAAQYHSSRLSPITVQWFLEPNDTIRVLHNNQTVIFQTNQVDTEGPEIFNTTGVLLTSNGSMVSASFDGTVSISVMALANVLHASSSLPEEYRNQTEGLLGVWNNNPGDDFMMPNGSTIPRNSSEETLFHYGMTWKINGSGLLGMRTDNPPSNFTPVFYDQLLGNKNLDQNLISECNGDQQCAYDTLATGNAETGRNTMTIFRSNQQMNATLNRYPPSIDGCHRIEAYKGQTRRIQCTSTSEEVTFTLRKRSTDIMLFENGTLLWTPKSLEPFTLEILARDTKANLSSVLQPKTVVCFCNIASQCLYNQTRWVGNSSLEVASCRCKGDAFGQYCERSRDLCDEQCFPNVQCDPGVGCGACPPNMTGDGRHCAAMAISAVCWNHSCPVNHCYNKGHCYVSQMLGCKPTCTCPPAFTDSRCLVAGNNFTPTIYKELPLRTIQLLLSEEENASVADVNASVAYRLGTLEVRAFLQNSQVEQIYPPAPASGNSIQHWLVTSEFQYRPRGPIIHFLNEQLRDAVVDAFLLPVPRGKWKRSAEPRNNVVFHPISREDVHNVMTLNLNMLDRYFKCNGYKDYKLVYSPQSGVICVSPCTSGFCDHGGQCQHLPDGPRCSCVPYSIYMPWGKQCEHLSVKLDAFFGILFGSLGALLLLGIVAFVFFCFWGSSRTKNSYCLDLES